jgi:glycosyltransferase involved in cell wall biosynthesis
MSTPLKHSSIDAQSSSLIQGTPRMKKARVISGLPVYNGERWLGAAIESHLNQSFGDFQLVLADNGSTDATPDICADYARRDPRIKVLRSEVNRGILWNHRRVMDAIESPDQYFRWAAHDDIMGPGLLEAMVNVLDTRPEVETVVPDTKNIDSDGTIINTMVRSLDLQSSDPYERAFQVLTGHYQMVIAFGLFRVSTLRALRTGADYIGWDFVFTWELALRGKMVQPIGPVLFRRWHPGAMSRVKTAKEMKKWVEPNSNAGMALPHWTWAYERMRALMNTPLSMRDKRRLWMLLARATIWDLHDLMRDVKQAARRTLRLSDDYTF